MNLSELAIQNYESKRRKPAFDVLIALADYFDVSLDYLVGRSDDRKRYWRAEIFGTPGAVLELHRLTGQCGNQGVTPGKKAGTIPKYAPGGHNKKNSHASSVTGVQGVGIIWDLDEAVRSRSLMCPPPGDSLVPFSSLRKEHRFPSVGNMESLDKTAFFCSFISLFAYNVKHCLFPLSVIK